MSEQAEGADLRTTAHVMDASSHGQCLSGLAYILLGSLHCPVHPSPASRLRLQCTRSGEKILPENSAFGGRPWPLDTQPTRAVNGHLASTKWDGEARRSTQQAVPGPPLPHRAYKNVPYLLIRRVAGWATSFGCAQGTQRHAKKKPTDGARAVSTNFLGCFARGLATHRRAASPGNGVGVPAQRQERRRRRARAARRWQRCTRTTRSNDRRGGTVLATPDSSLTAVRCEGCLDGCTAGRRPDNLARLTETMPRTVNHDRNSELKIPTAAKQNCFFFNTSTTTQFHRAQNLTNQRLLLGLAGIKPRCAKVDACQSSSVVSHTRCR